MGNFKMSICLKKVAEKSSTASMGFTREGSYKDDEVHSFLPLLPCQPSNSLKAKWKWTEKKVVERTLRQKQCWVERRRGCRQMTGPETLGEVSLPASLHPRASSLKPLLQFGYPWRSFPVESRSGPPSPDHLSETSFSICLSPVGLTFTGRVEAARKPNAKRTSCFSHRQKESRPTSPISLGTLTTPRIGPKEVTTTPHQMYQESGRRLERLSMMRRQEE